MAVFAVCLVLFLAMTGHSSATYCVCKDGLSESVYQKNIDYACGNGADCSQINQNGACYNPNTVKDHCNYAVNSYFQKKGQVTGSCDFMGSASQIQNSPSQSSTCVYPASASPSTGGTTPSTTPTPPTSTTPTPPTSTTPPTSNNTPITGTTPSTIVPGSSTTPTFGLGPTGTGGIIDNSALTLHLSSTKLFYSFTLTLLFSGLIGLTA